MRNLKKQKRETEIKEKPRPFIGEIGEQKLESYRSLSSRENE